jgi:hypothetical protein
MSTKCLEGADELARKYIKLMAEYSWQYLWDEYGAVNQETFPLPLETKQRLLAWAEIYHTSLNWQDPLATEPWSQEKLNAFEEEGRSLWAQLRQELGGEYEVTYFSEMYHREVRDLDELLHLDNEVHPN